VRYLTYAEAVTLHIMLKVSLKSSSLLNDLPGYQFDRGVKDWQARSDLAVRFVQRAPSIGTHHVRLHVLKAAGQDLKTHMMRPD